MGFPFPEPTLWINFGDAAERELLSGDTVRIVGEAGAIAAQIEVTEAMTPGTVSYPHGRGHHGGWKRANAAGGGNYNLLATNSAQGMDPLSAASHLDGIPVTLESSGG